MLIDIGFELNELKSNGVSALGIATHNGDIACMKLLIEAGADINISPLVSPLKLAYKKNNKEVI